MLPHASQISLHFRQTRRVTPQKSQGAVSRLPSASRAGAGLLKVERQIHRRRRMRQRAHRNTVHTGSRDQRGG